MKKNKKKNNKKAMKALIAACRCLGARSRALVKANGRANQGRARQLREAANKKLAKLAQLVYYSA